MSERDKVKMAIIAGASYAMKFVERNPGATESKTMKYVTDNVAKIIRDIEDND